MLIDRKTGLLDIARYVPSPNHDLRPDGMQPELIVIHNISLPPGEFGGDAIDRLFTNTLAPDEHPYYKSIAELRVSAHLLISRDGSVVQYVPFHLRAWHAGQSSFHGRAGCNDFSIGIELEGTDDMSYTSEQYTRLSKITVALLNSYPTLKAENIAGHSDIAPGRKTDPGPGFDWHYYKEMVNLYLSELK